jgi:hypothetical protein
MAVIKQKLPLLQQTQPANVPAEEKAQILRLPPVNILDFPFVQSSHNTNQIKSKVELVLNKLYIVRSKLELTQDEIVILRKIDDPKPNWITVELVNHGAALTRIYLADLGIMQYENLSTWNPYNWLEKTIAMR